MVARKTVASAFCRCGLFSWLFCATQEDVVVAKDKRPNLNYAGNMDVDAWRQREICKRLKNRLSEDSIRFEEKHRGDTDEALREWVRRRAMSMRRMPHPLEIRGGHYLVSRLGDWGALSASLGYAPPGRRRAMRAFQRLWEQEAAVFARERKIVKEEKRRKRLERLRGDASSET